MNFADQVGTEVFREVKAFKSPSGEEKLGFGVDFVSFDGLLYESDRAQLTEKQREEEDEAAAWDLCDSYNGPRDRSSHQYSSMRIYHVSGEISNKLKVGDEWKCEVVKCYLNPNENRTRDDRRKIHFSLRPLKKVVAESRTIDEKNKKYLIDRRCGSNHEREEYPCTVEDMQFRDEDGLWAYRVRKVSANGEVVSTAIVSKDTANDFMVAFQKKNGTSMETRRLRSIYRALPILPETAQ